LPIWERKLSLRERVVKLCIDLADADSEDDRAYEKAWDALRKSLEDWSDDLAKERAFAHGEPVALTEQLAAAGGDAASAAADTDTRDEDHAAS
jgi:hypothetical protein